VAVYTGVRPLFWPETDERCHWGKEVCGRIFSYLRMSLYSPGSAEKGRFWPGMGRIFALYTDIAYAYMRNIAYF